MELRVVRHRAVRGKIRERGADVTRRALDGLVRHEAAHAVVRRAQLIGHRVRKIKRDADQADGDPQDDDEHRAVLGIAETSNIQHPTSNIQGRRAPDTIGCSMLDVGCWMFNFHVQLPVAPASTMFVRDTESIGTTSLIGSVVAALLPAIWISTRTASGRLVFSEVASLVSQVSLQRAPS